MIVVEEKKVRQMLMSMFRTDRAAKDTEWNDAIEEVLNQFLTIPTFDTDIREYSDRLWKLAYERGKKEGIVCCKDCKNWDVSWMSEWSPAFHFCPMIDLITDGEFYCAEAEGRIEDGKE